MVRILEKYIINSNYLINVRNYRLLLVSHPEYPSIKAITDTLDTLEIANLALSVSKASIDKLPKEFLAVLNSKEGETYSFVRKQNSTVSLDYEEAGESIISTTDFKKKWSGKLILIEPSTQNRKRPINIQPLFLSGILILGAAFLLKLEISNLVILLLNAIGVYLSFIVIKEELGIYSKTGKTICSIVSASASCSEVIGSKTKLLTISLSNLCFIYFISQFLIGIFLRLDLGFTYASILCTIPILIFSVYNQAFILKQWCVLCLLLSGILIAQVLILITIGSSLLVSFEGTIGACFIFLTVAYSWLRVQPLIVEHFKLLLDQEELWKFKRSSSYFEILMKESRTLNYPPDGHHGLSFGATSNKVLITAIISPGCHFCGETYFVLRQLLSANIDKIRIDLCFIVPTDEPESKGLQIVLRMMEIYNAQGANAAIDAMDFWYRSKKVNHWQTQFGKSSQDTQGLVLNLKNLQTWCISNRIVYTPAIIINDKLYPPQYKARDLPFIVDSLLVLSSKSELSQSLLK